MNSSSELQLFLGCLVDENLSFQLQKVPLEICQCFIQDNETYLREVVHQDSQYLGKFLGKIADLSSIELFEKNIYSLLQKFIPDYPFSASSLFLFATPVQDHHNETQRK